MVPLAKAGAEGGGGGRGRRAGAEFSNLSVVFISWRLLELEWVQNNCNVPG